MTMAAQGTNTIVGYQQLNIDDTWVVQIGKQMSGNDTWIVQIGKQSCGRLQIPSVWHAVMKVTLDP